MSPIPKFCASTLSRKYLMSLTGLALTGFLIAHLAGNLTLLLPSGVWFNKYAEHLVSLGPLLWASEIGLLAIAAIHVIVAIIVQLNVMNARPQGYYAGEHTKGGESHSNISSRNMFILGVVILAFIVVHMWQFKYGAYYVTKLDGVEVRNLHALVVDTFANPLWTLFYVGSLLFVLFHLRHGIWSAFQSLGAMPGILSKMLYCAFALFATLLAVGFILLPIWIFIATHVGVIATHAGVLK